MKRNILSKIIILNLFFMCFFISVSNAKAEWDTTPPVLKNIKFSKDVVKAGESMEVYVDAEDADSGIESIYISFWNPSKNKNLDVYNFERDEKGRWVKTFDIPEFSESGELSYNFIVIKDRAGNALYIDKDWDKYSHGTLKVEGQTKWDTTLPVLKNIKFSKDVVKAGESMEVYVDAEDADSGIESIYISFWNPSKNKNLDVYNFERDEKGRWVKTFDIPEFSESGELSYNFIVIKDRAGNALYIDKDWDKYSHGTLKVEGQTKWDTTLPVLKNMTFSKDVVKAGESMEMYVDAEDADSGIESIYVSFWNPSKNKNLDVYNFERDEKGRWVKTFNMPEFSESGEWSYNFIVIKDRAGNALYIDKDWDKYSLGTLKVDGQVSQVELTRDVETPKLGQAITFTAKATGSSQPVY
ncbi:hypothetical protein ACIQ61_06275, partial [Bacillus cereus]|uniref:hypothetical protein n=4 Tax=Bacillus cereus TaxID=1396 RepID=UPI003812B47B